MLLGLSYLFEMHSPFMYVDLLVRVIATMLRIVGLFVTFFQVFKKIF